MTSGPLVAGDPAVRIWLRGAAAGDQERLRAWRNAAAAAFFQPAPTDAEAQRRWFEGYLRRDEDFLFMVMEAAEPRGCLGVRLADGEWDVYNVIRGERTAGSRGAMGRALGLLVDFARRRAELPVRAVVLAGNPAIGWYERHGFAMVPPHGEGGPGLPVRAVVLAGNPAIGWYERHGFAMVPPQGEGVPPQGEGGPRQPACVVMRWTGTPAAPGGEP